MDETDATDAEREMAARRRDLEREFDDKARDLKAQHKRQADKLQADRVDWDNSRKAQLKDLADRTERVKRQEDNHKADVAALAKARQELDATKGELAETRVKRAEVQEAQSTASASQQDLRRTRGLLAGATWTAIVACAGALLGGVLGDKPIVLVAAGAGLAVGLGLEVQRRRRG